LLGLPTCQEALIAIAQALLCVLRLRNDSRGRAALTAPELSDEGVVMLAVHKIVE
jgi:hypothetical protein